MLKNKTVKLRALEPADVDILYAWENNMEIWQVSNTLTPFSRFLLTKYIENAALDIYQIRELRLIIESVEENRPVGLIDMFDFDPFHNRAGLGILIHDKTDRYKGFASNALHLFIGYAFDALKLNLLYCNIGSENEASLKLFQKHHFSIIGKKLKWNATPNGWEDEYMLQLLNPKIHPSSV